MNLRDSITRLEALGPVTPITPAQAETIRRLVADQTDQAQLLDILGLDGAA